MERVYVSSRGVILLATLGLFASWVAPGRSAATSRTIELVYSGDGHADAASGAVFSPDGRLLLIVGVPSSSVWDVATKRPLFRLPADAWFSAYAFSPDSTQVVATGETTRVYDARTGALQHQRPGSAFAAKFSPAGDRVLIHGSTVDLWRPADGRVLTLNTNNPFDAAWSPDGARVAVASYDRVVEVSDANTGKLLASLPHEATVNNVWWYAEDALVTATSRHIRRWDTALFHQQTDITLPYYAYFVDVTRDGRRVAVMLLHRNDVEDGVRVFDLDTGALVHRIPDPTAQQGVFDDLGRHLVTAHDGIRVWDVETGVLVHSLPSSGESDRGWLSPDGALLVAVHGWSTSQPTQLWDVAANQRVALLGGHAGAITSLAFSGDGRYLGTASSSGPRHVVNLWRRDDGRLIAVYQYEAAVEHLAFSDDGNELATGDLLGGVAIWNTTTHERVRNLTGHTCAITGLDRRADQLLSASCDGTAVLWDARTGAQRRVLAAGHPLSAAMLSPDGATAITGGTSDTAAIVTLWDAQTGAARAILAAGQPCPTMTLAVAGTSLLAACAGTVRVWDLHSGELRHDLATDGADVLSASYSTDGTEILIAARDGIARRFDSASGALRATLRGDPDGFDISASHVGEQVVTASRYTGQLMLWDGTTPLTSVDARQGEVHAVIRDPFEEGRFLTTGADRAGTLRVWRLR